jgi:SAM-dependent methyltransferase
MREPFAVAARAFMFGDVVSEQDLVGLGLDLAPLRDSGLLVERGGGLASPFTMSLIDGLFILADPLEHGGDAVMGMGPLTVPLCAAAKPLRPIGRALDLGCGAGVVALLLSRRAVKVVATDINPRAVAMTRFNARLNALENVEVREGSLFEPVARERFDLIASQPPFIPQPEGATAGDFMTGGSLGDELSKKLMEVLPDHLVEGGLGVLVIEWAHGPTHAAPSSSSNTRRWSAQRTRSNTRRRSTRTSTRPSTPRRTRASHTSTPWASRASSRRSSSSAASTIGSRAPSV